MNRHNTARLNFKVLFDIVSENCGGSDKQQAGGKKARLPIKTKR
jgi:hypothetical protein